MKNWIMMTLALMAFSLLYRCLGRIGLGGVGFCGGFQAVAPLCKGSVCPQRVELLVCRLYAGGVVHAVTLDEHRARRHFADVARRAGSVEEDDGTDDQYPFHDELDGFHTFFFLGCYAGWGVLSGCFPCTRGLVFPLLSCKVKQFAGKTNCSLCFCGFRFAIIRNW